MPEPLTFKIITDADDSGVRKIDKGMGDLNISSRRASAAINSFSREIMQAKSGADLASASAESLAHIFHQGIAGAVIIGGVKLVSDQIKGMGELLRVVGEETAQAVKQLQRMGEPGNLQEAVKGADMLDQKLDAVTKKLEGIQQGNWFSKLLSQITGTTDELKAQEETLTRLRDAQIALGFAVELQNAQSLEGLNSYQRGLEQNNIKLKERLAIAERITDNELKTKAIQDAYRLSVIEANEFEIKISKQQEEAQKKLNELLQKRIDLQDQLNKAQQNEIIRQGELAMQSAGIGGTSRGPGQKPTSFETGLQKAADRAYQEQKRQEQQKQDEEIALDLYLKGGPGTRVTKQDIQREKVRRAEEASREKAKKEFEDPYQKQIEKTTKALQDNESEIKNQAKEIQNLGGSAALAQSQIKDMGNEATSTADAFRSIKADFDEFHNKFSEREKEGKTLSDIYDILKDNLIELKTYAHAV